MNIKKLLAISLVLAAGILFKGGDAFAATRTWDGSASDGKFSTAANWSDSTAPASGDSIVLPLDVLFSECTTAVTLDNDLNASSVTLAGLSVSGLKPDDCFQPLTISGNDVKSSGDIDGGGSGFTNFDTNIIATGNITITAVSLFGDLTFGSNNIVIQTNTRGIGDVTGSGSLTFSGVQGGQGGAGGCGGESFSSPFSGDASGFTGSLIINEGMRVMIGSSATALGRSANSITVNGGGLVLSQNYGEDTAFDVPITFNGGTLAVFQEYEAETCNPPTTFKTATISSNVTVTEAMEVAYLIKANLKFAGTVTGKEHLTFAEGFEGSITFADGSEIKSALKIVTIDNAENCNKAWDANGPNRQLILKVDCSGYSSWTAEYPFTTSGIVSGTGKMGFLKLLSGGKLAPGLSPGCLSSNNLTFEAGSSFEVELGGKTVCTEYDQQKVIGTVTLGNAALSVLAFNKYKLLAGSTFTILDNDGADAITGTFKDLAEGATFKGPDGSVLKISYKGGDGNDIDLTVITASTPDTGFGMILNNPALTLGVTGLAAGAILVCPAV